MSTSQSTQTDHENDLAEIEALRDGIKEIAYGNRTARALVDLMEEQARAAAKFPMQHIPDGTPAEADRMGEGPARDQAEHTRDMYRRICQSASRRGKLTWRHVLAEEFFEALAESDPAALRAELIQVANVALRWVKDIDRRAAEQAPPLPAPGTPGYDPDVHVTAQADRVRTAYRTNHPGRTDSPASGDH